MMSVVVCTCIRSTMHACLFSVYNMFCLQNHTLLQLRNELGIVCGVLDNGNVGVRYGHKRYIINPNALVKVCAGMHSC